MKTTHLLAALPLAALLAIGCGGSGSSSSGLDSMAEKLNQQAVADAEAAKQKAAADAQAAADAKRAEAAALANQSGSAVTTEDMQRGSKLKRGGYLQTVLKGGIRAEQKLNLATITHALNLYHAEHGEFPKSHEEFMEKIIDFNGIVLEPLQEPYEYYYNAEDGQLYKVVKQEAVDAANAEADAAQANAEAARGEPKVVGQVASEDSASFELPDGTQVSSWVSGARTADDWVYFWCDLGRDANGTASYRVVPVGTTVGGWQPLVTGTEVFQKTGFQDDEEEDASYTIGNAEKLSAGEYLYQVRVRVGTTDYATAGLRFAVP